MVTGRGLMVQKETLARSDFSNRTKGGRNPVVL